MHSHSLAISNFWVLRERERVAMLHMPIPEQGTPQNQTCVCLGAMP